MVIINHSASDLSGTDMLELGTQKKKRSSVSELYATSSKTRMINNY